MGNVILEYKKENKKMVYSCRVQKVSYQKLYVETNSNTIDIRMECRRCIVIFNTMITLRDQHSFAYLCHQSTSTLCEDSFSYFFILHTVRDM